MINKVFGFVIIFFFSLCGFSQQEQCSTVDLRTKMGSVLNQNGMGWVFAYTASDLVSFKLGKKVSPIDMAMQHYKKTDQLVRNIREHSRFDNLKIKRRIELGSGEQLQLVLADSAEAGFCSDESININNISYDKELYEAALNLNHMNLKFSGLDKTKRDKQRSVKNEKLFPSVKISELQSMIAQSALVDVVGKEVEKTCKPRIMSAEPLKFGNINNSNDDFKARTMTSQQFERMNGILSKNQPVGVSLYMDNFFSYDGADKNKKFVAHSMTLVGRRFNQVLKVCEYILRNSWGPECDAKYKVRCESGYLIVPQAELLKSAYAADFIE